MGNLARFTARANTCTKSKCDKNLAVPVTEKANLINISSFLLVFILSFVI
jgi:hypothetical protein